MTFNTYQDLGYDITRIDSGMIRPGLAALYLLGSDDEYALIETGTHRSIPLIMALLEQRGITPGQVRYVIPTHVHLDHAGGVGGLMQRLPGATLLVHPKGARHMIDPAKLKAGAMAVYGEARFNEVYGDVIPVPEARVRIMEDGEEIQLGKRVLAFHDTPGHARHHFCVHDRYSNGIFTGDTFGLAYPSLIAPQGPFIFPATTPVQFEPEALKASIRKLLALQPERMYLTHYGMVDEPDQLGEQLLVQIDDYVALARAAQTSVASEDLEDELTSRLLAYTVRRAGELGCEYSEAKLQEELGMDLRLNAQGLAVWLQADSS